MAASSHDWSWDSHIGFWRIGEADDRRVIEIKPPEGRASQLSAEELEAARLRVRQTKRMAPSPGAKVKRARKRSAAGFVNAILRQVNRDGVA